MEKDNKDTGRETERKDAQKIKDLPERDVNQTEDENVKGGFVPRRPQADL